MENKIMIPHDVLLRLREYGVIKRLTDKSEDYVKLYTVNKGKTAILCIGSNAQLIIDLNDIKFYTTSTYQLQANSLMRLIEDELDGLHYTTLSIMQPSQNIPNGYNLAENNKYALILDEYGDIHRYDKDKQDIELIQVFCEYYFFPTKEVKEGEPYLAQKPMYDLDRRIPCVKEECDNMFLNKRMSYEIIRENVYNNLGVKFSDGSILALIKDKNTGLRGILAEEEYCNLTPSGKLYFNKVKYLGHDLTNFAMSVYHNVGIQRGLIFEDTEKDEEYFMTENKSLYVRVGNEVKYQWYKIPRMVGSIHKNTTIKLNL